MYETVLRDFKKFMSIKNSHFYGSKLCCSPEPKARDRDRDLRSETETETLASETEAETQDLKVETKTETQDLLSQSLLQNINCQLSIF